MTRTTGLLTEGCFSAEVAVECRHCGAVVDPDRVELGYDYCTRDECVAACLEPIDVIAVAVNKASDQFVLKRDLDWSDPPAREDDPELRAKLVNDFNARLRRLNIRYRRTAQRRP